MDTDAVTINTALLSAVIALIGILSFVVRSLLGGIQTSMSGVQTILAQLLADGAKGRSDAVAEVREAIHDSNEETDKRIERLTRAVELSARTDLMRLIASPEVRAEVKDQARAIVEEIVNGGHP